MTNKELINMAIEVRKNAISPTKYYVGAALLTESGKVYTGCNLGTEDGIFNICAERVAFCKAVSEGETEFERIVIVGGEKGKDEEKCLPCGYCRQFMKEFVNNEFKICSIYQNTVEEYTLDELLPYSFELKK